MPGYQTAKTTVNLAAGARLPVPLTLAPVLALKLQFPSEGRVAINNEEPVTVQDGQFLRELPVGTYSVKILYRTQRHHRFCIRSPAGWAGCDHRASRARKRSPLF